LSIIKNVLNIFFNKKQLHKFADKYFNMLNVNRVFIIKIMSKIPLTASIYYMFFSKAFRRESYSVMQGIVEYEKNLKKQESHIYLLRRNIHRLEKGLIMQPRRSVFAKDYIVSTVDAFISILNLNIDTNQEDIAWANDVLTKYFSVTTADVDIDQASGLFDTVKKVSLGLDIKKIPYKRSSLGLVVSYDEFLNLCHRRRSVRWYLPKPVPRELVEQAILAGVQAPSACNRQPYKFKVIDEVKLLKKISKIPGGTAGFNQNFQMLIVVIGDLSAYFSERDRHIIYIDSSLATMNILLALETLGLSSCVINWPDIESKEVEMSKDLTLSKSEKIIMLVSVGWPDPEGLIPYSQKKNLEELRGYNNVS